MKKLITLLAMVAIVTIAFANNNNGHKQYFTMPVDIQADEFKANTVVFKFKEEYRSSCTEQGFNISKLNNYLATIGGMQIRKIFKGKQKPEREFNPQGIKYADLSLLYEIKYSSNTPLEEVINKLYQMGLFEYAEPYYIPKSSYVPNDPLQGNQGYLNLIRAYQAWDTQTGSTSVTIGITDTGIDIDHVDLDNAIQYNTADPIGGGDQDNDGYVDNYRGWDLGMNDNNPQEQGVHGCHVSGCASAETDNGTGVAASGFNTKILPVKISNNLGQLIAAYEGITYAADHGCDIINCSWGGGNYTQFAQDVITYATINKDALVLAAAGNNGIDEMYYPSSYEWVIRVAATRNNNDQKAGFSSYGKDVDVCAPGQNIYATTNGNNYGYSSGTSMACPVAAGAAAIILSEFPSLNAIQVGEQLKVTCDNIDNVNTSFAGKLGWGRINMENAVAGITSPSVLMSNRIETDNNDDQFVFGDTIDIFGDFTNYLATSGNLTATLTTSNTHVNILDATTTLGVLNMLQTTDNSGDPFRVEVLNTAPLNEQVDFVITIDDGNYTADICFSININVDYINITINEISTSITSRGLIGWNDQPTLTQGLGFQYNSQQMLFEGGLMLGVSGKVSDYLRSDPQGTFDTDFTPVNNVVKIPNVISDFDVEGLHNDDGAGGNKLDVDVHHKAYAWDLLGHTKYVIVEYVITNNSGGTLNNFYPGIFCDWDIDDYSLNASATNTGKELGYTYDTQTGGKYAGVRVLTSGGFKHYAIDNDGSGGSINIYDGYPTSEKYTSLSTNRNTAGTGDVANTVANGPFTVLNGDSIKVAFALLAGDDLADLEEVSDSAYAMYNNPCLQTTLASAATGNDASCGNNNGSTAAAATGGNSPYTYQWDSNAGFQTTQTATGLGAGTYDVTITDNTGCTSVSSVTIGTTPAVDGTTSSNNAACGNNDGDATATATQGTSPYTYQWDSNAGNQTTSTATGLGAGTYDVTITDNNGCTVVKSVNVSNSGAPSATTQSTTNLDCFGDANGSININVTGGLTPYTYNWNNSETTQDINGLGGGTYTVTITDANNCIHVYSETITEPTDYTITDLIVDVNCFGDANGSIDLNVSGATPGYTYSWNNSETTQDINNLTAGAYIVTITDANGCDTAISATVNEPPAITNSGVVTDNQQLGEIDITTGGGVSPYSYNWSGPNSYTSTNEDLDSLTDQGTYYVTITDDNGCTAVDSFIVAGSVTVVEYTTNQLQVNVYPNPNKGSFTVTLQGKNGVYNLAFTDVIGKTIYRSTKAVNGQLQLQLENNTAPGVYFLTVSNADARQVVKVVVE